MVYIKLLWYCYMMPSLYHSTLIAREALKKKKKNSKQIQCFKLPDALGEKSMSTEPWKLSQISGKPGSDLTCNKEQHYQKQNGKHVVLLSALTPSREGGREWQTFSDRPAPFVHPHPPLNSKPRAGGSSDGFDTSVEGLKSSPSLSDPACNSCITALVRSARH